MCFLHLAEISLHRTLKMMLLSVLTQNIMFQLTKSMLFPQEHFKCFENNAIPILIQPDLN